ncbi:hypothetical protein F5Y19DRAFT_470139 [Xylariaceae sp. FL1651]|nr:hypothetical protein F5Y19DRAFT_470139 [Xylariaceae sp. FL1651]
MNRKSPGEGPRNPGSAAVLPPHKRDQHFFQDLTSSLEPRLPTSSQSRNEYGRYNSPHPKSPVSSTVMNKATLRNGYSVTEARATMNENQTSVQFMHKQPNSLKLQVTDSNFSQRQSFKPGQVSRLSQPHHGSNILKDSPVIKTGLLSSRWADQSNNSTPRIKTNKISYTGPAPVRKQEPKSTEDRSAEPFVVSVDTTQDREPIEEHPNPTHDDSVALEVELHALPRQNDIIPLCEDVTIVADGWTQETEPQPSITDAVAKPIEGDPGIKTKGNLPLDHAEDIAQRTLRFEGVAKDPRINWPTDSEFRGKTDEDIVRQDWNRTRLPRKQSLDEKPSSNEEEHVVPQFLTDYIKLWIRDAHFVTADFLYREIDKHEDCDVDTYKGSLLAPVGYPDTKRRGPMGHSQLNMTSELRMRAYAAEVSRRDPKKRALRKAEKEARAAAKAAAAQAVNQGAVYEAPPNPDEVKTPCHLRPVAEYDIEAITAIYNQEIVNGYKVMDTEPVSPDHFYRVYNECRTEEMPFVVAIGGWHGETAAADQKVIGFALVTELSRGIGGSFETLTKPGGKLIVIVLPEYRRKKIGTALIDIIMSSCSTRYAPREGYQFVNLTKDRALMRHEHNSRMWWYLEMEVVIFSFADEEDTRNRAEFKWIWNFLEEKFVLLLRNYDEKCLFDPKQKRWLDRLTFRHICRTPWA